MFFFFLPHLFLPPFSSIILPWKKIVNVTVHVDVQNVHFVNKVFQQPVCFQ